MSSDATSPLAIVVRHRRHVELSHGVGKEAQDYALAVCDDIINDLSLLSETAPAAFKLCDDCQQSSDCLHFSRCFRALSSPSATERTDSRVIRIRQRIEGWRDETKLAPVLEDVEKVAHE